MALFAARAADARTLGRAERRLLLGAVAANTAPATYQQRLTEWAAWDATARGADFDD